MEQKKWGAKPGILGEGREGNPHTSVLLTPLNLTFNLKRLTRPHYMAQVHYSLKVHNISNGFISVKTTSLRLVILTLVYVDQFQVSIHLEYTKSLNLSAEEEQRYHRSE